MATLFLAGAMSAATAEPIEGDSVVLRALDKVTARTSDLDVAIGERASFGSLTILPRKCLKRPPEETPETTAFLEITERMNSAVSDAGNGSAATATIADPVMPPAASGGTDLSAASETPANGEPDEADVIRLFTGWMFASSPAINALEHPVYDVWVIDCKISDPATPSGRE